MSELPAITPTPGGVGSGRAWADWAGMAASIGCAIHCAAMPLVLAYLPALGLDWLADEGFHRWMAVVCFALAAAAFAPGWRRHGSLLPAVWGAAGLLLLTTAAFGMEGACCPACVPEPSHTTVACTDEACSYCQSESVAKAELLAEPGDSGLLAGVAPLVTPLGGLLLVIGHVANHRKSCGCQGDACCFEPVDSEGDA